MIDSELSSMCIFRNTWKFVSNFDTTKIVCIQEMIWIILIMFS